MDSAPPPWSSKGEDKAQQARQRRQDDLQRMSTTYITAKSWGESFLPVIVMAMEACWMGAIVIVIASTNFFGTQNLLLPLWAPFLLLAGTAWCAVYQERGHIASLKNSDNVVLERSGSLWLIILIICAILLTIWASIYSSTALLIDPRWLLSMFNDFLLLNAHIGWNVAIILIGTFCCWRGIRSTKRTIEPSNIIRGLFLGLAVFIVVSLILANTWAQGVYSVQLLILISLFFSLALLAHALAHAAFLRQAHQSVLQGSVGAQERGLSLVIGVVCASLLLVVLLIASVANPAFLGDTQHFLAPVGIVYDQGISLLASALTFLAIPIFWLFSLLPHNNAQKKSAVAPSKLPKGGVTSAQSAENILLLSNVLRIAFPVLCIAIFIYFIQRYLNKRRRLVLKNREQEDVHESLWSWQLFWAQLRAIWRRIFRIAPDEQPPTTAIASEEGTVEPIARSIREIYRAFLTWCANQGTPRKKYETPDEFKQRLDAKLPLAKEDLQALTEAYSAVRYGDTPLDELAVTQARQHWDDLRQQTL